MYADLYCNDIEVKIKNLTITIMDYRGDVGVILINLSNEEFTVNPGERIGQLVLQEVLQMVLVESDELSETARAEGGFGHTGK